jgi:SAM-dependent methyltransferase
MKVNNPGWFEEWFDSPYYHLLYKDRDDSEAEFFMDKLSDYLNIKSEDIILDLPCGKGRHARYLNQKGYSVIGADLSENSIKEASVFENNRLKFVEHDMRKPIKGKYDYIFNLFTSFGYFEEDENIEVLHHMKNALRPKGKLVIDFMNTPKVIDSLVEREIKKVEGLSFHLKREVNKGQIVKEIEFEAEGSKYCFEERVRVLTKEDFERYFAATDLIVENVFGDYNLNGYDVSISDRMIFVLKKSVS